MLIGAAQAGTTCAVIYEDFYFRLTGSHHAAQAGTTYAVIYEDFYSGSPARTTPPRPAPPTP